jgi:hypothetical protein
MVQSHIHTNVKGASHSVVRVCVVRVRVLCGCVRQLLGLILIR